MRHQALALFIGSMGVGSVAATGIIRDNPANDTRATIPVNVNVSCTGGAVQVSVDPWVVRLQQGDDIDWILSDQAQSQSIEISPKRPGSWAFATERHQGGRGAANAARARDMRPNQAGRRYQYDITLVCQDGGQSYTVVIDPDVEIED